MTFFSGFSSLIAATRGIMRGQLIKLEFECRFDILLEDELGGVVRQGYTEGVYGKFKFNFFGRNTL